MARQLGAVRYIGRLANTVGYKARDGKGDAFDAVRNHTIEVANPQTLAQMSQRMKLTPVQNFFRGLAGLLDHSWQGVKYGNPSRLHFYSLTMKALSTAGCPYVNKGERQFIPWTFPVSSGSIPVSMAPVISEDVLGDNDDTLALKVADIGSVSDASQETTVAALSEVLKQFLGVKEGMQVTFIFVFQNNGLFIPVYHRVIVDTTNDNLVYDLGFDVVGAEVELGKYLLFKDNSNSAAVSPLTCKASGIIVSALVNETWQRNNASLVIAESLRTQYNSQAAFNAMLESYRTSKNTNSDWYLNDGDEDSGSTVNTIKEVTAEIGGIEPTFAYYKVGATKYVPYFVDGEGINALAKSYRKESDYAFTKTGASSLGVATAISDTIAEFAVAGYSLVTRSDLLAIAPELTIPE